MVFMPWKVSFVSRGLNQKNTAYATIEHLALINFLFANKMERLGEYSWQFKKFDFFQRWDF